MTTVMEDIYTSLHELEDLVNKIDNPLEKEGLKAFINCITPQLMDEASIALLGKIAQTPYGAASIEAKSAKDLLKEIGDNYEVTIE
ncbi:histidine kinase [Bacillus siamensis]|uniref:hypothetical protein n=1 Tax=Bacillus TaxID=1386 RepID=UPI0003104F0A|nr:hypothetical protein [Bacillus siamensis]MED0773562.1 histidine kinase [Bacillus siamensis]MED0775339.1 histidine kinase [Bacillus siamensis]MED0781384.1 histidine kinase [Bacillus siamensis]MED0834860.1 histidine kinase [Bacillus siamensis]MED5049223.1 histidine kinase [Bacillus siamensis]